MNPALVWWLSFGAGALFLLGLAPQPFDGPQALAVWYIAILAFWIGRIYQASRPL